MLNYVSLTGYTYAFLLMINVWLDQRSNHLRATIKVAYISQSFDSEKEESSYILNMDFSFLYAYVMSEKIPIGNIRKLSDSEKTPFIQKGMQNHDENGDVDLQVLIDVVKVVQITRITNEQLLITHHMKIAKERYFAA